MKEKKPERVRGSLRILFLSEPFPLGPDDKLRGTLYLGTLCPHRICRVNVDFALEVYYDARSV